MLFSVKSSFAIFFPVFGLSKISEESRTAKSVKCVLDCFDKGMSFVETRNMVFDMNSDLGNGWFEAPSNIMLCENNAEVELTDGDTEIDEDVYEKMYGVKKENEIYYPQLPYSCRIDFNYASAIVMYDGEPSIAPNETKKIKVRFVNNIPVYGNK